MNDKAFKFSVIIKTDKDENKTRHTFESILQQNCFDEKIQVIFFGKMNSVCEKALVEYPDNVRFVDAESDVFLSQALEKAEGKYCLICKDGGYFKYKSTFKKVEKLFRDNKEQTDAVMLKTYYDSGKGDFLNYKFENGGHIIDIEMHPDYIHSDLNSVFVYTKVLKSALAEVGEDNETVVLAKILSKKQKYVISEDRYVIGVEKRLSAEDVAVFSGSILREWKKLRKFEFFRKALVYQLSKLTENSLPASEQKETLNIIKPLLELLENKDIASFRKIDFTQRLSLLKVKNGELRAKKKLLSGRIADSSIYADKENVGKSEDIPTVLYFASAENGKISIEASCGSVCGLYKDVKPIATLNGNPIAVTENKDAFRYTSFLDENVIERRMFKAEIDAELIKSESSLKLGLSCDGITVYPDSFSFNPTCLLEGKYKNHYLYDNGFAFSCKGNEIKISPCDEQKQKELEEAFIGDLAGSKLPDKDELIALRQEYFSKKDSITKPIWLISDRPSRAGDNGGVFFEHVMKNHSSEVEAYFVLSKESEDYDRISAMGKVVEPLSYEHKLLFLLAEKNISAQADIYVTNPFGKSRRAVHDLMKSDFIFLQHGVIKHDLSDWLWRYKKNIKGFVTSSPYERNSILESKGYGYDSDTVWLTGLPRFDKLYDDNKKIITFMPTWRKYLVASQNSLTGLREFDTSFKESEFYKFYQSVVNDERLLTAAEKLGYTIAFLPHPNMIESMHFFDFDKRVTVYDASKTYGEVFAQSALLVTDYSSAVFDFVYLRKPVVYCQFDSEKIFSGEQNYIKGYFDYESDGFGEVECDAESTVERIIEYMQNGCQMKDKFTSRADTFFAFSDKDNCKRVYQYIIQMEN